MTLESILQGITDLMPTMIAALPVALVIILAGILVNLVIARSLRLLATRTHLDNRDIAPAQRVLRWLVRIITAVLVLNIFGFQLGGIWSIISTVLAMVAIGFVAVWSLLSHTSATVLLVVIRPFQIGDDISIPSENVTGRVVDLNFFYTTLVDHEGFQWRVPNNLFFQKVMKRKQHPEGTALAPQLENPTPAEVELPPKPEEPKPTGTTT